MSATEAEALILAQTLVPEYPQQLAEQTEVVSVTPLSGDMSPGVGTLAVTPEPIIHGIVGAQYGDLEYDVGKSVRWLDFFVNDLFIMDINTGDQRYWVINWAESFPDSKHAVSGRNFFYSKAEAALWRKEQFEAAAKAFSYQEQDWVLFIDGHEGLSFDNRSLPDDYDAQPFMSWMYREIARAVERGQTAVSLPFFVYLKYSDLQNITYATQADIGGLQLGIPPVSQAASVPWYLPAGWMPRLFQVASLRGNFDWTTLDTPVSAPPAGELSYLDPLVGTISTPDPGPLPPDFTFVARIRSTRSSGNPNAIVGQFESEGQHSWIWQWYEAPSPRTFYLSITANGTSGSVVQRPASILPADIANQDIYVGESIKLNNAGRVTYSVWQSPDGSSWSSISGDAGATVMPFDTGTAMRIGAWGGGATSKFNGRIYSVEMRTGAQPIGSDTLWTPGYLTFPINVGSNWAASPTLPANPADASGSIRVECERQATDGFIHAPLGSNCFLMYLPYSDGNTYYYFYDTTLGPIGASATPAQMTTGGVPATGRWQFKIVWNAATDTMSLHGRDPALGRDLMDDTGWTQIHSQVQAGKQMRADGAAFQLVNGSDPSWRGSGKVWRAVMEINGTVKIDFDFRYLNANPGASIVLPTGQTCTFTKAATPIVGTPKVDGLVWKFDANEYPGTGTSFTDPRGRAWTLTSAAALHVEPRATDLKMQLVSYGYAHWNLQDIPPGETTVPALSASNDEGWKMRNLVSRIRPIAGIPYGDTWQAPNTDPTSYPGPWCVDTTVNVDPALASTVEETGHTAPAAACAGLRIPLYDHIMRLNLRDGLWYDYGVSGNIPLSWDTVNQVWKPNYTPEEWAALGTDATDVAPPAPSNMSLRLDGTAGTYAKTSDSAYLDYQYAFTLMAILALDNWNLGTQTIVGKWGASGQLSYVWQVVNGKLWLSTTRDGFSGATQALLDDYSLNLANGEPVALGVSFVCDITTLQDEVRFWRYDPQTLWSQVGSTKINPNPSYLPLKDSTADLQVGAANGTQLAKGLFRAVSIRAGIGEANAFGGTEVALLRGDLTGNPTYDRYGNVWSNQGTGWSYTPMVNPPL